MIDAARCDTCEAWEIITGDVPWAGWGRCKRGPPSVGSNKVGEFPMMPDYGHCFSYEPAPRQLDRTAPEVKEPTDA